MKNLFYKLLIIAFLGSFCCAFSYEAFTRNLHTPRLQFLKSKGFCPRVIYDIGAHEGSWTRQTKKIFPDSQFILFEANDIHQTSLAKIESPHFLVLLGNQEKPMTFYANGGTGDSVFLEQTKYFKERGIHYTEKKINMTTLSNVVAKHQIALPDFVKMDVQGAERLIIEGGKEVIKHAEAIVVETKILEYNKGAPLAHEIIALMDQIGYSLQDIFECHYLPTGELNEVDLLFIRKDSKLIKHGILIE